ncbi:GNAT family N-acetyltransferase [soil metagenome]
MTADSLTIKTARLTLQPHTLADHAECAAMWGDPEVTRFIGGRPASPEDVWNRLLRYAGLWSLLGYGYWAIRDRTTGRFVGDVGFADFHRDITPPLGDAPEVGWALAAWAHGQGFATEAVNAVLAWGDAHLSTPRGRHATFVCIIAPDNVASVRVAEKCGFRHMALATYKNNATNVYERPGSSLSG